MQQSLANTTEFTDVARAPRKLTTSARMVVVADRGIYRVAGRWLFAVNLVFTGHALSLIAAPLLRAGGLDAFARPIYAYNSLFCHQRDGRSFHLFGEKLACCERCAAIYLTLALMGLLYALLHKGFRRPRVFELALLALPIVVDGTGQAAGLWQSNAVSRVITGALLGGAMCWFMLPYLEQGFARIRAQIEVLFARLAAEGVARPL